MRLKPVVALTAILLGLAPWAVAQPPDYTVRTLLVPPASSDDTHQYGMSKLRLPYVCPACGYVQLYADTSRLARLLPDEKETAGEAR